MQLADSDTSDSLSVHPFDLKQQTVDMTVGGILRLIEEEGEKGPFQTLTPEAVSRLAAGFYFYGYKP